METYHGSLTLQLRNMAARPRRSMSETTALPFLKAIPPMAGNSANAKGALAQLLPPSAVLLSSLSLLSFGRGNQISFVDSLKLSSDIVELLRSWSCSADGRSGVLRNGRRVVLEMPLLCWWERDCSVSMGDE